MKVHYSCYDCEQGWGGASSWNYPACGVFAFAPKITTDTKKVTCERCKKTDWYKYQTEKEEARLAKGE